MAEPVGIRTVSADRRIAMAEKIRLLIVDDEERFLKTLATRLGMRDFEVTPISNGSEAVEVARQQRFDLALVDLKMPGISGEKVLELLKKNDAYIEVVILTGHGSIDSAVECTRMGCFGYLQKPCETEELIQVLKNAYQQRIQKKLALDEEQMTALMESFVADSPLGILRKLKEMESGHKK
jgi:two-component system NtrC family response regulator